MNEKQKKRRWEKLLKTINDPNSMTSYAKQKLKNRSYRPETDVGGRY